MELTKEENKKLKAQNLKKDCFLAILSYLTGIYLGEDIYFFAGLMSVVVIIYILLKNKVNIGSGNNIYFIKE